jgi:dihydrodipicolinate synthase/N-acetylneuraminate lyase
VTHTTADLTFDEAGYREHIQHLGSFEIAGLFAAGGTGEFFSLTHDEVSTVLLATVDEVNGRVPVMGAAGYGTSQAVAMAQQAEADGVLLLPPYLTELPRQGCTSTSPYIAIRDREAGYGVSIVKAGLSAAGRPAGPVRPPLVDLGKEELAELTDLVQNVI